VATEKNGWIKLHRKILDNPIIMKDSDHLAVWAYLLLNATHAEYPALFKGQKIMLQPGQLLTGRKSIADQLKISESKVTRILNAFKSEQQIEQQTSNKNRLISIINWDLYQISEQQIEAQMNNNRTTGEQQVNTNKNIKNIKNDKNEISNISDSIESKPPKPVKHKYGEYKNVLLTDEELQKLKTEYSDYEKRIDNLSEYVESTGKKYKSHYATIRKWARKDKESGKKEIVPDWMNKKRYHDYPQHDYNFDELEADILGEKKTVGSDPELRAKAEALRKEIQGNG